MIASAVHSVPLLNLADSLACWTLRLLRVLRVDKLTLAVHAPFLVSALLSGSWLELDILSKPSSSGYCQSQAQQPLPFLTKQSIPYS